MSAIDYAKWDALVISDDEEDHPVPVPAPVPAVPNTANRPFDPTRVAAMGKLLDEIDDGRRGALAKAIRWVEHAKECFENGVMPDDTACPFNRGEEPWFWFLLLTNTPHATLHGPYLPLLPRHRSAREESVRSESGAVSSSPRAEEAGLHVLAARRGRRHRRGLCCARPVRSWPSQMSALPNLNETDLCRPLAHPSTNGL